MVAPSLGQTTLTEVLKAETVVGTLEEEDVPQEHGTDTPPKKDATLGR